MAPIRYLLCAPEDTPLGAEAQQAFALLAQRPAAVGTTSSPKAASRPRVNELSERLWSADLVIADVSSDALDVYYWVGKAHGCGRATLLVAHADARLHFNVSAYPVLRYRTAGEIVKAVDVWLAAIASERAQVAGIATLEEATASTLEAAVQALAHRSPPWVTGTTIESLRALLGVRVIDAADSGKTLDELPPGSSGFVVSWAVARYVEAYREHAARSLNEGPEAVNSHPIVLTAELLMSGAELAKDSHGTVFLLGAATEQSVVTLAAGALATPLSVSLYPQTHGQGNSGFWTTRLRTDLGVPVAIPLLRIQRVADRSTRFGTILDLLIC